jgi:hypothetical protein
LDPQCHPPAGAWLTPRLVALQHQESIGAALQSIDHAAVVDEVPASQRQIELAHRCHLVEVEAGRVEYVCHVQS